MKNFAKHIAPVPHECYDGELIVAMPSNRVPSLSQIVAQLESGRPMDTTLDRNLGFNTVEGTPCFRKGYDLVDAWHDLHQMKASIEEANEALENAKSKAKPVDTTVTPTPPPEPVPTTPPEPVPTTN